MLNVFSLVFWAASIFFQFRSVSVSISIIWHAGLFFRSYSGNLPAMFKRLGTFLSGLFCTNHPENESKSFFSRYAVHWNSLGLIFNSRRQPIKRLLFRSSPFYNSKSLNCIGALSFFKDLVTHFHDFWSQIRVVILVTSKQSDSVARNFFALIFM